jgi:hypothetical protein
VTLYQQPAYFTPDNILFCKIRNPQVGKKNLTTQGRVWWVAFLNDFLFNLTKNESYRKWNSLDYIMLSGSRGPSNKKGELIELDPVQRANLTRIIYFTIRESSQYHYEGQV